jgi:pimeloyl-ACP methyl ester carboxylesterase
VQLRRRALRTAAATLGIALAPSLLAVTPVKPRHVIYLHGRIVQEQQSARPESPRFGFYELDKIVAALRQPGFTVTSSIRPRAATVSESADAVVKQVRQLLASRVAPDHVTVVGVSMGGGIAMLASARLQEANVRFAVLGVCLSENALSIPKTEGKALAGRILAIREKTDDIVGPCADWTPAMNKGSLDAREIVLSTGLSHGFIYRPLPEWANPVINWVKAP